jgi:TrmH family RNA methyltransferase
MKLEDIKKLHQKKYRQAFGHFLVEGEHLILELEKAAHLHPQLKDVDLFVTEAYRDFSCSFRKTLVSDRQMALLSDTKTPQGIIALVPFLTHGSNPAAEPPKPATGCAIYLHEIQDPGNLGTILRTLAWFGGMRCLLSPGSVDPYNPKVVRASMGAIFHVPIELDVALDSLPARFRSIALLDTQGDPISTAAFKTCECYVFGNEARGIPHAQISRLNGLTFCINGGGALESLNLATAVNICAYELNRQMLAKA